MLLHHCQMKRMIILMKVRASLEYNYFTCPVYGICKIKIQTFLRSSEPLTSLVYAFFWLYSLLYGGVGRFRSLEAIQSVPMEAEKFSNVEAKSVIVLAKKALSASREATLLAEQSKLSGNNLDVALSPRYVCIYLYIYISNRLQHFISFLVLWLRIDIKTLSSPLTSESADIHLEVVKTVKSTRLLERRSKRRGAKTKFVVPERNYSGKLHLQRKITEAFDKNDALRIFTGPETKLLTANEESDLIMKIQVLFGSHYCCNLFSQLGPY